MTVRVLGGIIVEKTRFDMKTCQIIERTCELNPDDCCSVSDTCFPKPIQKTLYYNPASFFCDAHRTPSFGEPNIHRYQAFWGTITTIFGPNALESYFPFRITLTTDPGPDPALPATWIWSAWLTSGYSNSPSGNPNDPGVTHTYPRFSLFVEFRITKLDSPIRCEYNALGQWGFKMEDDGLALGGYGGDFRNEYGSTTFGTPVQPQCGSSHTFGLVDGYNQYNPYSNYIEFDCQRDVEIGDEFNTSYSNLGVYPIQVITSEPQGFELPPIRSYACPNVQLPPRLRATLTATGTAYAGITGVYTLTWRYGKYYYEGAGTTGVGGTGAAIRFGIEVHPTIGKRMMHRCSVRIGNSTGAIVTGTHDRWQGRLKVERCSPYWAACPNLTNYASVSVQPNMSITVEEF